jgi:hypothetical protein
MNTSPANGTTMANFLSGKESYSRASFLPICTYQVTGIDAATEAMDALELGLDVEVMLQWFGGGGHAPMVTSMTALSSGGYIITYIDDPAQGDDVAANEEYVLAVDQTGYFDYGQLLGFQIEYRLWGDIDGDGKVDLADLGILLSAWKCEYGDYCYDPNADFNCDDIVDLVDLGILLAHWEETCP